MLRPISVAVFGVAVWATCNSSLADEALETQRAKRLETMRSLAEGTKVSFVKEKEAATFVANPVFRYDDQPRNFIDATMWVWTRGGRPVAFQKIEAMVHYTGKPMWGYCFTSLGSEPLAVAWAGGHSYQSTEAGTEYRLLPGAPPPATKSAERKRQMRDIARSFSARLIEAAKDKESSAMRLLPTPIFEFSDPESKSVVGGVFGFASNGTNPDLLVVLEAIKHKGDLQWHFGAARMTNGGLRIAYKDVSIWEADPVKSQSGRFETWTFFNEPRE